eukprot:114871-Ditylum_brightwellii.AAC.3
MKAVSRFEGVHHHSQAIHSKEREWFWWMLPTTTIKDHANLINMQSEPSTSNSPSPLLTTRGSSP